MRIRSWEALPQSHLNISSSHLLAASLLSPCSPLAAMAPANSSLNPPMFLLFIVSSLGISYFFRAFSTNVSHLCLSCDFLAVFCLLFYVTCTATSASSCLLPLSGSTCPALPFLVHCWCAGFIGTTSNFLITFWFPFHTPTAYSNGGMTTPFKSLY